MGEFKAVLFDLDGTLLDTLEDLADSMNSVLRNFGFPEHDLASYKKFIGDGMPVLAQRVLPSDKRTEEMIKTCVAGMRAEYDKRWANKTRLYNGMAELLNELAAREMKVAILSNKPDDFMGVIVSRFLGNWDFSCIMGAKATRPKKPDPAGALEIAEQLKIAPHEFIYLGDTDTDMQTANAAGMYAVGVLWGFRAAEELLANGAKCLIEKPTDLIRLMI